MADCKGEYSARNGRLILPTAAMGGAYEFSKCASANLRQKDDSYNGAIGGFFAGSMLGLRCTCCTYEQGYPGASY